MLKNRLLSSILFFSGVFSWCRVKAQLNYNLMDYKASVTYPKLRCVLTSRAYAVDTGFKTSRFTFRRLVGNALVPGIERPSW